MAYPLRKFILNGKLVKEVAVPPEFIKDGLYLCHDCGEPIKDSEDARFVWAGDGKPWCQGCWEYAASENGMIDPNGDYVGDYDEDYS